ncbi:MAG: undecaprenyldiphospho-muramoylpentapeptide beta-N-acetylglucosaminyltransferase [Myxococcota bacterium]
MIHRAVIAGGKTGGHLYPGVAVAEEILARDPAASVTFVGTEDGLESRVLPRLGYPLETLTVSRLKGGSAAERLKGLLRVPGAMLRTARLLRRLKPQVVLGVGGYASGPALLAAWLLRVPTAIQEQNAWPGFTNRVLGRLVHHVYLGFEAAARFFSRDKVRATGNPIRRAVVERLEAAREAGPTEREGFHVLVFGGSQGARFLNERVPEALVTLQERHPDVPVLVVHQTGTADEDTTRDRYAGTALETRVEVLPYIDDMPSAYAEADVAVCRAGALTVAELTAMGLPALLVPFPFAADDHQTFNARVLADAGAGLLVPQSEWDGDRVVAWLSGLVADRDRLAAMSERARLEARPDAASRLVDHLEEIAA